MNEQQINDGNFISRFYERNDTYLSIIWGIALFIGYIYAIIEIVKDLFLTAQDGNIIGFVVILALKGVFMILFGFIYALIAFVILFCITCIPYFLYKGLKN